jgi:tetratricopeptide (TPR) repeat protein
MDELLRKLAELRDEFVSPWSEARCRRLFSGICQLRRRRRLLGALGACSAGLVAVGLAWGHEPPDMQLTAAQPAHTAAAVSDDWLAASQRGDYQRAYELLAEGAPVANDAETLLRAADAARLSDHAEASVGYFRALLRDHREHPAAASAAFTLGRELLEHLGRPVEAALAFAAASELAHDSTLAHDALAREVESWSKAGRAEEAYRRALLFNQRYPDSHRQRMVQLFGGLASQ